MAELKVELRPSEAKALRILAFRERRDLHDQAAILIRAELQRAGLIPGSPQQARSHNEWGNG
jgi:hypothetical protein